jgi:hypothetical protein
MPSRSEGSDTACVTLSERRTQAQGIAGGDLTLQSRHHLESQPFLSTDFDQFVTLADGCAWDHRVVI